MAYVLLAKYILIRTANKCVLSRLIDQYVSAAALSLINKLDNVVNNWTILYQNISIDGKNTSLQYLVYNDLHSVVQTLLRDPTRQPVKSFGCECLINYTRLHSELILKLVWCGIQNKFLLQSEVDY